MRKTFEQMALSNCATANTLALIGGKWKILILYHLLNRPLRFNELECKLGTITSHTLSKELKELQEDKLVNKEIFAVIPPKTVYSLTKKGYELEAILKEIHNFGKKYPKLDK
ncbi:winged helix-turn-helix transcriptional regulator [Metaclostridioides mangenotii]|uniref:winged helix-turn-helix transcriptional regulator n=1 Tax=Metaclostridioides mangenotii TaxID=1540 RepID=UPI0006897FC3|nr:helix-turn-helix domain-containing protein [Clostridioides mangenotii]